MMVHVGLVHILTGQCLGQMVCASYTHSETWQHNHVAFQDNIRWDKDFLLDNSVGLDYFFCVEKHVT